MKKVTMSLLLIAVMILSISVVSATDLDGSDDLAIVQDDSDTLEVEDVSDEIQSADDNEALADSGDSGSNFTQLQKKIDESDEITLDSNYKRVAGENDIVISKNVKITGTAEFNTIDADNLGGIFKVNSGSILTLVGITLKNGKADKGGAIYNEGNLDITNCKFTDNSVNGCNYQQSTNDCTGGAAIYTKGDLKVTGSTFTKNTAPHDTEVFSAGGAIYVKGKNNVLIDDCTFNENSATYAGAIMFEDFSKDTAVIKNSNFNNNQAWQGGAIYGNDLVGSLIITDSKFTANKAVTPNAGKSSPMGGAIMIGTMSFTGVALEVSGCNFKDNTAVYMGGAISSSPKNTIKLIDSEFTNNHADVLGGALITGTESNITVTGSTFTGNTAGSMGNAIFAEPGSKNAISSSTFKNNGNTDVLSYQAELTLSGNTVSNKGGIRNYGGVITTETKIVILENKTVYIEGNNADLTATITDDNGNVINDDTYKFVINGEEVAATYNSTSGLYKANYTLPSKDLYTVSMISTKDEKLNVKTGAINNLKVSVDATDMTRGCNSPYDYQAKLVDEKGNAVADKQITFTIKGKQYTATTDSKGIAELTTSKLAAGTYDVIITNPFTGENTTKKLTIKKRLDGNKNVNKYYKGTAAYKVRVFGDDGKAVGAGVKVTMKLSNGKSYTVTTDKNGWASKNFDLAPGSYKVTVTYKGTTVKNTIKVKHVLKAKSFTKKKYKVVKFKVKLLNGKGKALAGKKVTIKVFGQTFKKTTNSKGIATLKFLKNKKTGKYTIKISYLKDTIKKTVKITR